MEEINEAGEKVTVFQITIRAEAEVIKAADIPKAKEEEEKPVEEAE